MDEDFGFVERRGGGNVVKNEDGKLTNGRSGGDKNNKSSSGNLHPDDDCRDATSGRGSEELSPSIRKLFLSSTGSAVSSASFTEENSNGSHRTPGDSRTENNSMLKHIKTSVKSGAGSNSKSPGRPALSPISPDKSPLPSDGKADNPKVAGSEESETQLPLPQRFVVKYLGYRETSNLWGIKYTRRPVDEMVAEAKAMLAKNTDQTLPLLKMEVTDSGILIGPMPQNNNPDFPEGKFPIESISYGVQDLVYTRVFAMIVVRSALISEDQQNQSSVRLADIQKAASGVGSGEPLPFRCHAFVCDSRQTARKLTYSLAAAFHKFSKSVAAGKVSIQKSKKFAIDLRSPEDIEADLIDSEA